MFMDTIKHVQKCYFSGFFLAQQKSALVKEAKNKWVHCRTVSGDRWQNCFIIGRMKNLQMRAVLLCNQKADWIDKCLYELLGPMSRVVMSFVSNSIN
jgi:hypothetical protein